jgi:DNA-3-methyladenine glycosylase II
MPATTQLHTLSGILAPCAPFDGAKSLAFLRAFSPAAGEQTFTPTAMTKAVGLDGRAIACTLRNAGTLDTPALAYDLTSERPITDAEHAAMRDRISFFLDLDADLAPFYAIGAQDQHFAPVIKRFAGLHQPKFLTPFEIACWAVLGQRVPLSSAHRTKLVMVHRWGTHVDLPDATYWAFPEVAHLAAVPASDLAEVVDHVRKGEYLQAVIRFFLETDEAFLRHGAYDDVAAALRGIRGIGEWSAHFILVRGLGRMERISTVDGELAKAAAILYNAGQPLPEAAIRQIAASYGAHQGYWAYYARIAVMRAMDRVGMA